MSTLLDHTAVTRAIAVSVRSAAARDERARRVAESIRAGGDFDWVGIYDVLRSEIAAIGWTGTEAPAVPRFPRSKGLNGVAVASGRTVVVNDVRQDSRYLTTFERTGSEMIVPVRTSNDTIVGTIDVESPRTEAFGQPEILFVEHCAQVLAPLWISGLK